MEQFVEFSAKTKNEAITKACIELGTSSDQLDIEVITEGSSGFFGFGSKPARIRVRRKESFSEEDTLKDIVDSVKLESIRQPKKKEAPKKEQKPQAPRNPEKKSKPQQPQKDKAQEKAAPSEKQEDKKEEAVKEPREKKGPKEPREAKENKEAKEPKENKEARQPKEKEQKERSDRPQKNRHRNDRPRKEQKAEDTAEAAKKDAAVNEGAGEDAASVKDKPAKVSKPVEILTDENEIREIEERAVVFLRDVFASMDLGEVEIKSVYNREEGCLDVDFEGEDMGVLIGKRGQTLDSLQYLTSLVVNKGKEKYIRVKLDTEDYRRRRKDTLENLAKGIAYKVKKTRKAVVLEPMNPYERRIIHSALQGSKYVETVSEGEDPYRHIVVKPKRY